MAGDWSKFRQQRAKADKVAVQQITEAEQQRQDRINRGELMRIGPAGEVCMCRSKPGEFYHPDGRPATDAEAASAGFDVAKYARLRRDSERPDRVATLLAELLAEQQTRDVG